MACAIQLKQVMKRWKSLNLRRRSVFSKSDSDSDSDSGSFHEHVRPNTPSGFFAVYVGPERRRFVIPIRFINLPIFESLLQKSVEEFGYNPHGALVLPCDAEFFERVLKVLEKDEQRFGNVEFDEFLKMFRGVGLDSCKEGKDSSSQEFSPLMPNARV